MIIFSANCMYFYFGKNTGSINVQLAVVNILCSNKERVFFGAVAPVAALFYLQTMTDKEKTAFFIGNRDCYQVKEADIERAIINAIENGIKVFLNGGQGFFDQTCASIVHRLKKRYPHIKSILVILYRDFKICNSSLFDEIVYPFESHTFSYYTYKSGSQKRNQWAVDCSSVVICYVYRTGGAEKTLEYAKKQKLRIIDLTKGA